MRSQEKTKLLIVQALEEELKNKSLEHVSIRDIMNRCNLSRQTFYRHFIDIYDLVLWFHNYNAKRSLNAFSKNKDIKECFILTLNKMNEHNNFYINALSLTGPNSFINNYFNLQMNYAKEHIGNKRLDFNLLIQLRLFWYGVTNLLVYWIKLDVKISPEVMAENIFKSLPTDLKKYYE